MNGVKCDGAEAERKSKINYSDIIIPTKGSRRMPSKLIWQGKPGPVMMSLLVLFMSLLCWQNILRKE